MEKGRLPCSGNRKQYAEPNFEGSCALERPSSAAIIIIKIAIFIIYHLNISLRLLRYLYRKNLHRHYSDDYRLRTAILPQALFPLRLTHRRSEAGTFAIRNQIKDRIYIQALPLEMLRKSKSTAK